MSLFLYVKKLYNKEEKEKDETGEKFCYIRNYPIG